MLNLKVFSRWFLSISFSELDLEVGRRGKFLKDFAIDYVDKGALNFDVSFLDDAELFQCGDQKYCFLWNDLQIPKIHRS